MPQIVPVDLSNHPIRIWLGVGTDRDRRGLVIKVESQRVQGEALLLKQLESTIHDRGQQGMAVAHGSCLANVPPLTCRRQREARNEPADGGCQVQRHVGQPPGSGGMHDPRKRFELVPRRRERGDGRASSARPVGPPFERRPCETAPKDQPVRRASNPVRVGPGERWNRDGRKAGHERRSRFVRETSSVRKNGGTRTRHTAELVEIGSHIPLGPDSRMVGNVLSVINDGEDLPYDGGTAASRQYNCAQEWAPSGRLAGGSRRDELHCARPKGAPGGEINGWLRVRHYVSSESMNMAGGPVRLTYRRSAASARGRPKDDRGGCPQQRPVASAATSSVAAAQASTFGGARAECARISRHAALSNPKFAPRDRAGTRSQGRRRQRL